jgi:uncharacterized protein
MTTATLTDNATTVTKMYDAFSRGDISYILKYIADDCKWIGAGEGTLPQGGRYVGKDAANFFKRLGENEEFTSFNPVSVNAINDDEVIACGYMEAMSKATRKKVGCDWIMHWRFNEEGKVIYFHDFFDTAAAYLANQPDADSASAAKEQNIALVKNAFSDFLKGNIEGVIGAFTDDIEWGGHTNSLVPYAQTYHGKAGASEFFKTLASTIDYSAFEPQQFYADANKIFVKGYHRAKVKSTGNTFGHNFLMEFTLANGKISSFFAWIDSLDQARAFQKN